MTIVTPNPPERGFWFSEELAKTLDCNPKMISRWVREGRLECQRVGNIQHFYPIHVEKFYRRETRRRP